MKKSMVVASMVLLSVSAVAQAATIKNWAAPSTWTQATGGRTALIATTYPPLPFIPVTPCRLIDTRTGSGFSGAYGPPSMLGGGAQRSFTITGQCGVPAGAQAVSFNFSVWVPASRGNLLVFPAGSATPNVSTLNWEAGILALANAAVVPLGSGGAITVGIQGPSGVDMFVDVNGYYSSTVPATQNSFSIYNPTGNTGIYALGGNYGIAGLSSAGYGLYGASTSGIGTYGGSSSSFGVYGGSSTSAGVFGISTGTSGMLYGIIGYNSTTSTNFGSAGVRGTDAAGTSTNGFATNYAPSGVQGVCGDSVNCYGVHGVAIGSGGYGALFARQNTTTPWAFTSWAGFASSATQAGTFHGDVSVSGTLSKGGGSFKIDHPLDPENKYLYHSFVESPDMMNIYNGIVTLNEAGEATVDLPDYFEALNRDFRYQLTSIGRSQPQLYIADEVQNLKFRIAGGRPNAKVSWQVTGIRQDAFANAHRIQVVVEKEKALRGTFLHPVEQGQPPEKSEFLMLDGKPIAAGQRAPAEN